MTGETILVVDDHPPNLALMSHLLGMHGYDVVTAADARETLAKVSEKAPRLVLSELSAKFSLAVRATLPPQGRICETPAVAPAP